MSLSNLLPEARFHCILKTLKRCTKKKNYLGIRIFCREECSYRIDKLLETHLVNLKNWNDLMMTFYERRLRTMGKFIFLKKRHRCLHEGNRCPQSLQILMASAGPLVVCIWAIVRFSHAEPGNCYRYQQVNHIASHILPSCSLHNGVHNRTTNPVFGKNHARDCMSNI